MHACIIIGIFAGFFFTFAEYLGIFEYLFGRKPIPRDYNFKPNISIMLTVFKEGREVTDCVHSIMASDYPLDLIQIVACDDASPDDSYHRMELLQKEFPDTITIMRNEENLGKPYTLLKLAKLCTGEIIFNIDSDTIIAPDAISKVVSIYADPKVGAVGSTVRIKNVNDSIWTQLQTIQYWWCEAFLKPLENMFRTSRCLFGPMCSFRREAYMPLQDAIRDRNFLGVSVIHGEDTFITALVALGEGREKPWLIYTDPESIAWTGTPATMETYMNQQLRWRKGAFTNGTYVMSRLYDTTMRAGIAAAIMSIILTVILVMQLIVFVEWWLTGNFLGIMVSLMLYFCARGLVLAFTYNVLFGSKKNFIAINKVFFTGLLYGCWFITSWLILSAWGIFTLDNSGWLTRQKHGNIK